MKVVTLTKDGTITLPKEILRCIGKTNSFLIMNDKENIILKSIKHGEITEIPKRKKDKNPLTLDEISNEVHKYREGEK